MTPEDARRAARLAYGGVEQAKQRHRDERAFQGLGQILQDARYTFRQLRKSPGFTVTAILMLALGIGATTAIFSIVEGVLLRPLPFPDPDRLVTLGDVLEGSHCASCAHSSVTAPDIRNYMRDTQSFSHLGGYRQRLFELSGTGDPAAVNGTRMSGEVFAALGVPPLLGRTFTQHEDEEHQQVAVLSYGMWRSRFHGCERTGEQDPSLPQALYRDRRDAARVRVSAQPGACEPQRALASAQPRARRIYGGQRGVVELSHGGALKARHHCRAGAKRCRASGPGDDARLSGLHAQSSYSRGGDAAARRYGGASATLGAHPALCSDRCSADRLCEPGGASAGACHPQTKRDRGAACPRCSRGHVTATGHRGTHGIEYRGWRDRAGTGGCRFAGGRKPATADATSRQ